MLFPPLTERTRRLVWLFQRGVGLLGVVAWFLYSGTSNEYVGNPRAPSGDFVVPFETKGIVVYITSAQQHARDLMFWVFIACVVPMVLAFAVFGDAAADPGPDWAPGWWRRDLEYVRSKWWKRG